MLKLLTRYSSCARLRAGRRSWRCGASDRRGASSRNCRRSAQVALFIIAAGLALSVVAAVVAPVVVAAGVALVYESTRPE
ncbi:hypothetical protein PC128_g10879 [Phytophthora cactorum]|nr:hypothetical protein PC128_g10879 [Phytophthora cactorum]